MRADKVCVSAKGACTASSGKLKGHKGSRLAVLASLVPVVFCLVLLLSRTALPNSQGLQLQQAVENKKTLQHDGPDARHQHGLTKSQNSKWANERAGGRPLLRSRRCRKPFILSPTRAKGPKKPSPFSHRFASSRAAQESRPVQRRATSKPPPSLVKQRTPKTPRGPFLSGPTEAHSARLKKQKKKVQPTSASASASATPDRQANSSKKGTRPVAQGTRTLARGLEPSWTRKTTLVLRSKRRTKAERA